MTHDPKPLAAPVAWQVDAHCDTLNSCLESFWCLTKHATDDRLLAEGAFDAVKAIRSALATPPQEPSVQKPVAWQHRLKVRQNDNWSEWSEWRDGQSVPASDDHIKSEIRPLFASPAGDRGSVKALEWRDLGGHSFPDMWCATTPCGVYDIEERNASDSPTYVALGPNYSFIADKDSLEAAKAAAQADFEQRILSALSTEGVSHG